MLQSRLPVGKGAGSWLWRKHRSPYQRVNRITFYGITCDKKMRPLTMDARAIKHQEQKSIVVESGAAKTDFSTRRAVIYSIEGD